MRLQASKRILLDSLKSHAKERMSEVLGFLVVLVVRALCRRLRLHMRLNARCQSLGKLQDGCSRV